MSIFHACDIRGIAGETLTEEMAYHIALAIGVKLTGKKVAVGGDVRLSTPVLKAALMKGLAESGCQVMDLGTVATPVFYYGMKKLGAEGGVMVTASHNPAPYNGFKPVLGPQPVTEEDVAELGRMVKAGTRVYGEGSITKVELLEEYIEDISRLAKPNPMKVVLDAGSGATSHIAPGLFRKLGYDVVELFCEADGRFPHRSPNPALAENLTALCAKVKETGASIGVAFDGDGDRVAFVDENGRPVDNDDIIVLLARYYLEQQPGGAIIYDAKCSMVAPEEIKKAGGRAVMARAGHTFSKAAFLREQALFAGEISGHFFFRELGNDDGMFAGLKICEFVAEHGSLAALIDGIPNYLLTPDIRVKYTGTDKEAILDAAAAKLAAYQPNRIDGVRIEFADGWGMIRSSVTEPLFTFRFEAKNLTRLTEIVQLLLSALPEQIKEEAMRLMPPLEE